MSKKNNATSNTTQKIKCDVNNCDYNNSEENICNLNEIKVSSTQNCDDVSEKKETICDSFECDSNCNNTETE